MRSRLLVFTIGFGITVLSTSASAQFDAVLDKVRQGADQVNANNPTYYLKSARAVEPNICLYSNGDPTGVVGPLVFRNSYVASPNCRDFKACSEVDVPEDDPRPADCGQEIPNSRFWSTDQKPQKMRSDGASSLEYMIEELMKDSTCTESPTPA